MSSNPANNPSRCLRFGAHGRQYGQGSGWPLGLPSAVRDKGPGPSIFFWPPEKVMGFGCVFFFFNSWQSSWESFCKRGLSPKLTQRTRKITAFRWLHWPPALPRRSSRHHTGPRPSAGIQHGPLHRSDFYAGCENLGFLLWNSTQG